MSAPLWVFGLLGLAAILAVVFIPELASELTAGSERQERAAQFAATSVALLACTAGYLCALALRAGLDARWALLTLGYGALLVIIKFILSPAAFDATPQASLAEYVGVGLVVMVFYCLALALVYALAQRVSPEAAWSRMSKVRVAAGLVLLSILGRVVAVAVVGAPGGDYLHHVFSGAGLILPVAVGVAVVLVVEAFDRARRRSVGGPDDALRISLGVGVSIVLVYHALWVVYMVRLFS